LALVIVGLMVLGLASSPPTSAGGHAGTDAGIKNACEQLILDYASLRDQRRGTEFANLFAADGVLTVNDETFVGRQALEARFAKAQGQRTRHMVSNIRITVHSAERASGVSYALIFVGEQLSPEDSAPVAVSGFTAMGEYHDEFVLTEGGWRIAGRRFIPAFVPK
jgi:hypothetical protein